MLRSAMLLLKKRISIADKNYDKIAKLLEYIAADEELGARERQKLYSALGELELSKLSDISTLVSKLMEKLPEPVSADKNIEIIISDHGCGE